MFRLSKLLARLEKPTEKLEDAIGHKVALWYSRYKKKLPIYIPLGLLGWYIYGMFLNSLRLGTAATFRTTGEEIESIWVFDPIRNWFILFTPFGVGVTLVVLLLICLITKKGYVWFSGYKFTRDPRGFDILPDATHGSSGFLTKKEMGEFLELGSIGEVKGMMLGKHKKRPDDPDQYADYVAHRTLTVCDNLTWGEQNVFDHSAEILSGHSAKVQVPAL